MFTIVATKRQSPNKGGDLLMLAILPQDADGLAELEKELSREDLQTWTSKLQDRPVHVLLPKSFLANLLQDTATSGNYKE